MEMCYNGALVMPSSYAAMNEEEMTYVEAGWSIKAIVNKRKGVPVGALIALTATVSEMAWITAAGAACAAAVGACCAGVPVIGPILASKGFAAACGLVALAATIVATNDRACKKKFTITRYIGI